MDTKKTLEDSVNLLENIKYNDFLHGYNNNLLFSKEIFRKAVDDI